MPIINKKAWNALNDIEQYNLCNDLIKLCNKFKKENANLTERLKKNIIKKNLFIFKTNVLLTTDLNIITKFNLNYNRIFLNIFVLSFDISLGFYKNIFIKDQIGFIGGFGIGAGFSF